MLLAPRHLIDRLAPGDRLSFADLRDKSRHFDVVESPVEGIWRLRAEKTAWIDAATVLRHRRKAATKKWETVGEPFHLSGFVPIETPIRLVTGDLLRLTHASLAGEAAVFDAAGTLIEPAHISVSMPGIIDRLHPGQPVWIDDGKIGAVVDSIDGHGALLRVTQCRPGGARLRADKGLNLPGADLGLGPLSERDLEDLDFVVAHADLVGFSFVESGDDMRYLARELERRGGGQLGVVAKIETRRAVEGLPDILLSAIGRYRLGVMIARGDLAVEIGGVRLAEIQEELLWLCEAAHVPVIWATQVLETMAKTGAVSRPEMTDAAMSSRAECVMLNKGPYILDAVHTLDDILRRMQDHQRKKTAQLRALRLAH